MEQGILLFSEQKRMRTRERGIRVIRKSHGDAGFYMLLQRLSRKMVQVISGIKCHQDIKEIED